MLIVFAGIIYSSLILFILGAGFKKLIGRLFNYHITGIDNLMVTGLVMATVYAQFFSLFYKVGIIANLLLICFCVVIAISLRKDLLKELPKNKAYYLGFVSIIVLVSFFVSRGYIHYDSDLYHAQSIRWIEEYGVVKGLGNLHGRLAYNSSLFAVTALFSLRDVFGQSLHIVNGVIAIVLLSNVSPIFNHLINKKIVLSDFIRLGIIYYFVSICADVNSPASDYAILMMAFYIILKWVVLLEENVTEPTPYALLCMLGVYAVTLKLSACVILLLMIKPIYDLIKDKRAKEIIFYVITGVIIVLPWCIRNVIISGYIIYPFPGIDIFNFDWKIPLDEVIYDANEIKFWGRNGYEVVGGMDKILLFGDFVSIGILVIKLVIDAFRKKVNWDRVLVMATVIASFIFWRQTAPLIRYGFTYVLLLVFMTAGIVYEALQRLNIKYIYICALIVCTAFIGWKSLSLIKNVVRFAKAPYYIKQIEYNKYDYDTYEIDGVTIYYPVGDDRIGYDKFPASVFVQDITLRGDSIKDGFRVR